jgi:hypothetical protein
MKGLSDESSGHLRNENFSDTTQSSGQEKEKNSEEITPNEAFVAVLDVLENNQIGAYELSLEISKNPNKYCHTHLHAANKSLEKKEAKPLGEYLSSLQKHNCRKGDHEDWE